MQLKNIALMGYIALANAEQLNDLKARQQANNLFISIPQEWNYKLPPTFAGNTSTDFVQTVTNNATIDGTLLRARSSPFISYSDEFLSIANGGQRFKLVSQPDSQFAYGAGVWVPSNNQVWFTSSPSANPSYLSILNLNTSTITRPNTSLLIPNPSGGYYFNGRVYITAIGNDTLAGGIYSINPVPDASGTHQTDIVVNSYFGARFNSPNDVTWSSNGIMYFSDPNHRGLANNYNAPPGLPNAIWRFDPGAQLLQPVISRADILNPAGIRVNKNSTHLYITDASSTAGTPAPGSPAIYQYDLTTDGYPTNKKLIGFARRGVPNGLQIDDQDRIWTAESEGIVVRSPQGRILGLFNAEYFLEGDAQGTAAESTADFALAGDTLVILALQRVWTIKMGEVLISPSRFQA